MQVAARTQGLQGPVGFVVAAAACWQPCCRARRAALSDALHETRSALC